MDWFEMGIEKIIMLLMTMVTGYGMMLIAIFTTVTGCLFFLIWCLMKRTLLKHGGIRAQVRGLRGCIVGFLLPVMAMIFFWHANEGMIWGKYLPYVAISQAMKNGIRIFLGVWASGMIVFGMAYLGMKYLIDRRIRWAFRAEEEKQQLFRQVCDEMGISPSRIRLQECREIDSVFIIGVLHPRLILPVRDIYEENFLRVSFVHELVHYQHKDLIWKQLTYLVCVFHWFQPVAWLMRKQVNAWCEYDCDEQATNDIGDRKMYFRVLAKEMEYISERKSKYPFRLLSGKSELEKRIRHSNQARRLNKMGSKKMGLLLCMLLVLTGTVVSYAASLGITAVYTEICYLTEAQEDIGTEVAMESISYNDLEVETGLWDGEAVVMTDSALPRLAGDVAFIDWSIAAGSKVMTQATLLNKGKTITILVYIEPQESKVRVGVVNRSTGKTQYVTGYGKIIYDYDITEPSMYSVYVENASNVAITVSGSYGID